MCRILHVRNGLGKYILKHPFVSVWVCGGLTFLLGMHSENKKKYNLRRCDGVSVFLFIFVCVRMCVFVYVCMHVFVYVCECLCMYVCMCLCTYVSVKRILEYFRFTFPVSVRVNICQWLKYVRTDCSKVVFFYRAVLAIFWVIIKIPDLKSKVPKLQW